MSDHLFLDGAGVRQRFAGRMSQLLTASPTVDPTAAEVTPYVESPKVMGPEGDGTEVANKRFSILMTKETCLGMGRAGPANDHLIRFEQAITLRTQYVLRPNAEGDQLTDYDRATGPEARAILAWMLAVAGPWQIGIHPIAYEDADRRVVRDGRVLIVDYHFTAQHNAQLVG